MAAQQADQAAIEAVINKYVAAVHNNSPAQMFALCTNDAMLYIPSQRKPISKTEAESKGLLDDDFKQLSACDYKVYQFKNWRFKGDEAFVDTAKSPGCPGTNYGKSKPSTMDFRKTDSKWMIIYSGKPKR